MISSLPNTNSNSDTPTTTTTTTTTRRAWAIILLDYAKQRLLKLLSARRPWRLLHCNNFSCPHDFPEVISRIKTNFSYFYMNFAIATFSFLLITYFFHPISLSDVTLLTRDGPPIVLCGRRLDYGVTFAVLSCLTVFFYHVSGPNGNILIGVVIAAVYVAGPCIFLRLDDLFLNEPMRKRLLQPVYSFIRSMLKFNHRNIVISHLSVNTLLIKFYIVENLRERLGPVKQQPTCKAKNTVYKYIVSTNKY
ncbi:hypothetical protein BVRB_7g176630 [Beta vulgaris subsp. vulgaris]|nr:hypothetical protein BVRB_7g176630 [Beta vulgaris subsp. vulgaris]